MKWFFKNIILCKIKYCININIIFSWQLVETNVLYLRVEQSVWAVAGPESVQLTDKVSFGTMWNMSGCWLRGFKKVKKSL